MSEDTFPEPDEEELEAANALRQALEGRPAGSHVPEEALETAAFLRHAGDGGRLSSERRAKLRAEVLVSLPAAAAPARRKSWRDWLGIGITLLGGASAAVTVGVLGLREWNRPDLDGEARSQAMETAAYGDESSTPPRPAATAAAPLPAAPMGSPSIEVQGPSESDARLRERLEAREPAALARSSAERRRVIALEAPRAATPSGSVGSSGPLAASPRAESSERPGAFAKSAPGDLGVVGAARGGGATGASGGINEAKGSATASKAPASPAARAPANAAAAAPELDTEARIARQRQEQRSRLLARLAYTPAPAAYREADRARSRAELERAREQLTALSGSGLGGASSALEAEQLRPDVYCRLAELSLRLSQPRAALDWVRQGLELGQQPTPFVACLYQQQGRAREALGDRDGAAQSYMNALKVNEQLLNESLDAP